MSQPIDPPHIDLTVKDLDVIHADLAMVADALRVALARIDNLTTRIEALETR